MNKKLTAAILAVIIIIALSVTAYGISGYYGKAAQQAKQPYANLIENRMNFTIDSTSFSYSLEAEEDTFNLSFTLTAAKTEADFYAVLNSITLTGMDFLSVIYEPGADNGDFSNPYSLVLPVGTDGKPLTLSWNVTAAFKCSTQNAGSLSPKLMINYTSGLKKDYSDNYMLTVPLNITVLNSYMLSSVIADANEYLSSDIYTATSLNTLKKAVNTAEAVLADKDSLSNEKISAQCAAVSTAIQSLIKKG